MPVHLFCQMADMGVLTELADERGLLLVEDSAEAIGMWWDGVHAGLLGAGGVLSFFPTKTLGAFGDAGMVLTNDDEVARTARALRNHGRPSAGAGAVPGVADLAAWGLAPDLAALAGVATPATVAGGNAKMDELQAAVLLAKLGRLDRDITRRAELARAYTERLQGADGVLRLPTVVERGAVTNPVFYVYLIEVEQRDELVAHLAAHGIGTEVYYPRPLHTQPCFADLGYRRGDFPRAESACDHAVGLPFYPDLTESDVDRVCRTIRGYYTGARA
jgi:dTDP-4-amino-4,6-dideoxygalactose transaminase